MSIDLPHRVQQNIDQFTGRAWLPARVLDWYRNGLERVLLLTGGPGTGKSMIMAWLAGYGPLPADAPARDELEQIRAQVAAAHFCVAASGTTDPRALAQNVAEQLTRNVPGFADALAASLSDQVTIVVAQQVGNVEHGSVTGVQIGTLNLSGLSEEAAFNRTLRTPLRQLYDSGYDRPMLILVDALDEALTYTGAINIATLLSRLDDVRVQVRFLVTTRDDPRVVKLFPGVRCLDLMEDAPQEQADVRTYVDQQLRAVESTERAALVERISRAAAGNFLYAHLVLADLLPRLPAVPDLEALTLPPGLGGLYAGFLTRELGADEDRWYDEFEPVLGLLAVAQAEGMGRAVIERITRRDARRALRVCKQYLDGPLPDGPFRCFHRSFIDWLLEDENNVHYHIDGDRMHRQIVDFYRDGAATWQEVEWGEVDDYGLSHLVSHVHALAHIHDFRDDLQDLMCRSFMQAKRLRTGSHLSFADDVRLAIDVAGKESPPDLVHQVRNTFLYATLGDVSRNVPGELLEILARRGRTREALDMAALISNVQLRYSAFRLIAGALAESGDTRHVAEALDRYLSAQLSHIYDSMGAQMVSNNDIAAQLTGTAVLFDRAGMLHRFFNTYHRFAGSGLINTMAILSENLAREEKPDVALRVVEAVLGWLEHEQDPRTRVDDLTYLAHALALAGEHERAVEVAERGVALITEIDDLSLLIWLAPVFADARHFDRSEELVERFPDPGGRDLAYLEIVSSLLRGREHDRATSIAAKIGDTEKHQDARARIAAGYARDRHFNRALEVLEAIEHPAFLLRALSEIVEALVQAKEFDRALTTLRRIAPPGDPDRAQLDTTPADVDGRRFVTSYRLGDIAAAMAGEGLVEQATPLALQASQLAPGVGEPDRSLALRHAVEALAAAGMFEDCQAMVPLISDINERVVAVEAAIEAMTTQGLDESALKFVHTLNEAASVSAGVQALARARIRNGNVDGALQLVDLIPVAYNKALAMSTLVKELIARGCEGQAAALLEEAVRTAEGVEDKTPIFRLIAGASAPIHERHQETVGELAGRLVEMVNHERLLARMAEGYAAAAQLFFMLKDWRAAVDATNALGMLNIDDHTKMRHVLSIVQVPKERVPAEVVIQFLSNVMPTIQAMPTARERSALLLQVVSALCNVGALSAAAQMAGQISNRLHQALALCKLAEALARAGVEEAASGMLDQALNAAEGDFALWQWEGQQMHVISEDLVESLAGMASAQAQGAAGLAQLATTLAGMGRMADAGAVALRAEAAAERSTSVSARCQAAVALVRAGMRERSESLCRDAEERLAKIEDFAPRAAAWVDVAGVRMALDQPEKARACIDEAVKVLSAAPYYSREDVVTLVLGSAPIVAAWDDGRLIVDLCRAILDVETWWASPIR